MILTSHIIVGGLLGAASPNYYLAGILGFVSHYVLDAIPHWDNYLSKEFEALSKTEALTLQEQTALLKERAVWQSFGKIIFDMLTGAVILIFLGRSLPEVNAVSAAIGAFFGILPDPLELLYFVTRFRFLSPLNRWHNFCHLKIKPGFWPGLSIQTVIMALTFSAVYLYLS